MSEVFDRTYADEQIRRRNSPLRRLIKSRYLSNILRRVSGPTIDLGCGAGQLLERLPPGSVGLEINDALLDHLKALRVDALRYDALADDFGMTPLQGRGPFKSLVCSHVIEHFDDPARAVRNLLGSAAKLGVERALFIVPGKVGYDRDETHRVFVTEDYVRQKGLSELPPFRLAPAEYFPGNWRAIGDVFVYHETLLTWLR